MLTPLHQPATPDAASEALRHAYNAAFNELDLNWYWDCDTFARLSPYGRAGVRSYLEQAQPHLLRAYDADFLVDAIEQTKDRHQAAVARIAQPQPVLRAA